jgi:hypothetical protein
MGVVRATAEVDDRIATLRTEVERLAYASPPPAGRDRSMRELKAAIGILTEYRRGATSWRVHADMMLRMLGAFLIGTPLILLLNTLIRAARGRPPLWESNPNFWQTWPLAAAGVVGCAVGLPLWDAFESRRRLRRARALVDRLRRSAGTSPPAA